MINHTIGYLVSNRTTNPRIKTNYNGPVIPNLPRYPITNNIICKEHSLPHNRGILGNFVSGSDPIENGQ